MVVMVLMVVIMDVARLLVVKDPMLIVVLVLVVVLVFQVVMVLMVAMELLELIFLSLLLLLLLFILVFFKISFKIFDQVVIVIFPLEILFLCLNSK